MEGRSAGPVLVAGAGGFIGGHLVARLLAEGRSVRAVDLKPVEEWYQRHEGAENVVGDLTLAPDCRRAADGVGEVYNLAADMGGMGFIENNKALCMLSVLINTHLLAAARDSGARRYFFSSSACVYAAGKQTDADVVPLVESDAYPAMAEDGYGWEKLFSERMCRHFREDFGLETRVARYHNVYGPDGTYDGGREKAPAAICRKVAECVLDGTDEIEIWGDGHQTRSFMYIDDCVAGTRAVMDGPPVEPVNLGSAELVSINELVDVVASVAGITVRRRHRLDAPQGVRGRSSDNTRPQARIVCFGPLAEAAERISGVADGPVEVHVAALGAEPGTLTLNVSGRDDSSSLLPIGRQAEEFPGTATTGTRDVPVRTLAEHLERDLPGPVLLKIDVQGYELEVLRGAGGGLTKVDEILCECSFVELYTGQPLAGQVVSYLDAHGFAFVGVPGTTTVAGGRQLQADMLFRRA